ncbi:unnamed protein product [Rotaria sp. Silwood2]|nr:unnamed protein product [Rotaria sp. Silwood2]
MTSSFHCGEYQSIVQQIKEEAHQHFQEFNIVRIKIKSSTSNEGVPQTDIDMKLFWNKIRNYFEFNYHVSLESDHKGESLKKFINQCQTNYRLNSQLSRNVIKQINEKNFHHRITMDLFHIGRRRAFEINDEIVEYSTQNNFPSPEITSSFTIYDSFSELDQS